MSALTRHGTSARIPNARFMAQVREDENGCWIWMGPRKRIVAGGQYGSTIFGGRTQNAHRVAWQLFRGPIPAGLHIDHLCRVTRCVNPLHLEPVTKRENNLRSDSPAAQNARKTHCIRGHEFTPENTANYQGRRTCRTCINAAQRRRTARKREEQAA